MGLFTPKLMNRCLESMFCPKEELINFDTHVDYILETRNPEGPLMKSETVFTKGASKSHACIGHICIF